MLAPGSARSTWWPTTAVMPAGSSARPSISLASQRVGPRRGPFGPRLSGGCSRPSWTSGVPCRSRCSDWTPTTYRKNDNCFGEQKNWTHVRQQVGYGRYDTPAELEALNELYGHLRLYVNFFLPQMRLVEKTRQGATVRRRHDRAKTPYHRILEHKQITERTKRALKRQYRELNPAELKRRIVRCQDRLLELGRRKNTTREPTPRREVKPSPDHPWRRTFSVRQRRARSRTS